MAGDEGLRLDIDHVMLHKPTWDITKPPPKQTTFLFDAKTKGKHCILSNDGLTATRSPTSNDFRNAIAMSDRPLVRTWLGNDELIAFSFKIADVSTRRWQGSVDVGLTTWTPAEYFGKLPQNLNRDYGHILFVYVDSNNTVGEHITIAYNFTTSTIFIYRNDNIIEIKCCKHHRFTEMAKDADIWAMIDVYGMTTSIRLPPLTINLVDIIQRQVRQYLATRKITVEQYTKLPPILQCLTITR
jgi:hypothetical protein